MTEENIKLSDDQATAVAVVMFLVVFQLALPFLLYLCAFCMRTWKERTEKNQERRKQRERAKELDRLLDEVEIAARSKSQSELAKCVQDYQEAAEERSTEQKRTKGCYRDVTLVRLISLEAYSLFFIWLVYFVSCEISQRRKHGALWSYLRIMALVMIGVTPIVVFIESVFSHEVDYIKNTMEDDTVESFIQKMHELAPEITMTITCYHYETKSRDSLTKTSSGSATETKMVVTFQEDFLFSYGCFLDTSERELPVLKEGCLTRIKIDPSISLGDRETKEEYERQKRNLIACNRHRDKYISLSTDEDIPGLDKRFSAYSDSGSRPWWVRPRYFWLATLLMMSWPYRWLFRAKTAKIHYALKKKIYTRTTPPRKVDVMDSVEHILRRNGRVLPDEDLEYSLELTDEV